jgi:glycosyltransferase involved in cell wall biosynthesis
MPTEYELMVVVPVYNEQDCIAQVLHNWLAVLKPLVSRFKIIVINDGSRDQTALTLEPFAGLPEIEVVNKSNSGHGPTILLGYGKAVAAAEWVFQTDADDEIPAAPFADFWARRAQYDFLFGRRTGRAQGIGRKFISWVARRVIGLCFGSGVADVNVPYRLMRAQLLREQLPRIPPDTFAPNILIAGMAARAGHRICNLDVPYAERRTGTVSIVKWKLLRVAVKAFWQSLRIALGSRS